MTAAHAGFSQSPTATARPGRPRQPNGYGLNTTRKHTPHPFRFYLAGALLAGGLALTGCDINKPELPSFDSRLTLPLGTELLTVADAVEDDSTLVTAADGGVSFIATGAPDTVGLGVDLDMDLPAQNIHETVGVFDVSAPDPVTVTESLVDAWPDAAAAAGTSTPVPPFDFDVDAGGMDLGGIGSVTLDSGLMTLTVSSTWPVGISGSGSGDPLLLTIRDDATGLDLLTVPVGPVPADGTVTTTADLSGLQLPGSIRVTFSGHGDGSADPVPVTGDESLRIDLAFTGLTASSATAAVPGQTFSLEFTTDLDGAGEITAAEVASGDIVLALHNELPVAMDLQLEWREVTTPGGAPLVATATLPAGGNADLNVPFAGCRITSDGQPLSVMTVAVTATTPGSAGAPVTLSSTQGLTADLAPGVLSFAWISACLDTQQWDLEPVAETIDYPEDSEGFAFTRASLVIDLDNTADMGAALDLVVTGIPRQGDPVTMEVHDFVDPAGPGDGKTTLVLDETNSDIVSFLNSRPVRIVLGGTIGLVEGANCGTVRADDSLAVGWRLEVPLAVTLDGVAIDGDPVALDLDPDLGNTITDHAGAATLQATVKSMMPAGIQLWVLAADNAADLPDKPGLTIGPLTVAPAEVDPATGEAVQAVTSHPTVSLTAEESRYFGRPGLQTMFRAVLPDSTGGIIRIMSTDYLEVTGVVSMDLRIDEEL